jgi:hypothetical protein
MEMPRRIDRCRWYTDPEIGRWLLPGCMGAAVYGPRGCTCGTMSESEYLEEKVSELEDRVRELERQARQAAR